MTCYIFSHIYIYDYIFIGSYVTNLPVNVQGYDILSTFRYHGSSISCMTEMFFKFTQISHITHV